MNEILLTLPIYVWITLLGLAIGSFLNVVIYRTETERSFRGRSFCPICKKKLLWYDNIPLIGFLNLRGKCRFCKKKISWQYPMVEFLTSLLFLSIFGLLVQNYFNDWLFHYYNVSAIGILGTKFSLSIESINSLVRIIELIFLLSIISVFVVITVYDLKHLLIPNSYILAGLIIVLSFNILADVSLVTTSYQPTDNSVIQQTKKIAQKKGDLTPNNSFISYLIPVKDNSYWNDVISIKNTVLEIKKNGKNANFLNFTYLKETVPHVVSLFTKSRTFKGLIAGLIFASFFYFMVAISKEKWMGMGDVKLVFFLGLFLGITKTTIAVFLAFQIGAIIGLVLMALKKATGKTALPFGPFLILGSLISLFLI